MTERPRLAVLGGTGQEGRGLSARFAVAGYQVVVGSRDAGRAAEAAQATAEAVRQAAGTGAVWGATNLEAAAGADVVVLATPYEGMHELLGAARRALAGKVVVSAVVPMTFAGGRLGMTDVAEGSAAEAVATALPESRVVGAFHTVAAKHLLDLGRALDEDVPLVADDGQARAVVAGLCGAIGVRGVDAGGLRQARFVEGLTPMLVGVNRANRVSAGIRFVGLE
ncbi:MAG TPA: NADPH-dependent F420 reductase [Candidatus Dormibacteraeota bacterium]|nr:NADPH-dependent F420 reductase [Candidatus Dormibacteraeota bacterium]